MINSSYRVPSQYLGTGSSAAIASRRNWRPVAWLGAALLLMVLQIMSGTGPVFAALVCILMVVSYSAIRMVGGLDTLLGICIFFLLLEHVLVAQIVKVCLWQPADAPLMQPVVTMAVYIVGMGSLGVGGYLARRLLRRRKKPLFAPENNSKRLLWISVICSVFTLLLMVVTRIAGGGDSGDEAQGGPFKQFTLVAPLAIAAGTGYVIQTSQGRRSIGWLNGIALLIQIGFGVQSAVRNSMVSVVVIYILSCLAFRFRFRVQHFAIMAAVAYVFFAILFPYSEVSRTIPKTGNFQKRAGQSADLLMNIIQNPAKYRAILDYKQKNVRVKLMYYKNGSNAISRFALLNMTDGIVDATINSGTTGTLTIIPGFQMLLPKIFNGDKPFIQQGNFLAHRESGLLPGKHDLTTGITVGFFADAFSAFAWTGIALIPGFIMFCFVLIYGFILNLRIWGNIFALSLISNLAWGISEKTIDGQILNCVQAAIVTVIAFLIVQLSTTLVIYLRDRLKKSQDMNYPATGRMKRIEQITMELSPINSQAAMKEYEGGL